MLAAVLQFSVRNRWLVVLLTVLVAALGLYSFQRLPIDAVPDITNNQVQINTLCPALSPVEVEQQVTFPIEVALAGIPGLQYTRSLSRNGFSQVTAVFDDHVDIYFARQQVDERLGSAGRDLPPGAEPVMGPIATGLGEIYMWTVEWVHPHGEGAECAPGRPGWQRAGVYLTPEGRLLTTALEQAAYLREVQDWIIRPQLVGVRGVAGIDAIGGFVKQYQVQPDPLRLLSYGLTFHDVIAALERNNASTGAGYVEHQGEAWVVRATGRIQTVEEIAAIPVGYRGGVPVYVRDVVVPGGVGVGRELLRTGSAAENGEEVVVGTAIMLIGANSRTVAAAVNDRMVEVRRTLPPDVRVKTVLDRTKLVDATIRTVRTNLVEGAALVVAVLLLLLGNLRAALLCALAIPLAMLMTAIGMVQAGVSGNLMSLGAIDFGLIVDGAVIIVENCLRRLAERQRELGRRLDVHERLRETMAAAREMIQPTVYGQAIIITVYLPVLTLTGVEGKMFEPMALTVIFALVAAFVLSLTFVPAAVALAIRGAAHGREMFLVRWIKAAYAPTLRWSLRLRWAIVAGAVAAFSGASLLFLRLGQEFVPTLDEHDIAMHAVRIPSTGLTQSTAMENDVLRTIAALPEVEFAFAKTGTAELASDPMPPNVSDTFIILRPESAWRSEGVLEARIAELEAAATPAVDEHGHDEHHDEHGHDDHGHAHGNEVPGQARTIEPPRTHKELLVRLIELEVGQLPGNNYEFTQPIQMRFNELISGVRSDVAVKVFGDDFAAMQQTAQQVVAALQAIPGAADVKAEQTEGQPVLSIAIDRRAAARFGLDVADVQDLVAAAIGGREAGQVFEGDRRFDLVVRLPDVIRTDLDALGNLPLPLPQVPPRLRATGLEAVVADGELLRGAAPSRATEAGFIPLSAVARLELADGLNQISRENGKRRIVVQANVRGRDLGSFVEQAQQAVAGIGLPPGGWVAFGGTYENLLSARQRLAIVVPLCFSLIFLLLFGAFRSAKYALLVFSAVPLGLTGGILALWLRGLPFSISAAVGFIALSGVAVLNGLVMVGFVNQLRAEGLPRDEAIVRGCLTRLRPVLMTALVASLGFLPMALATGTGAEVQRPLATVVIGGLVTSTLLTLVVLPALYRIFAARDGLADA